MLFSAYLGVAGLTDVGYRFYTTAEAAVAARSQTSVVDAGSGWYSASISLPATAVSVRWDSTGTPAAVAREYFNGPSEGVIMAANAGLGAYAITQTVTDGASNLVGAIVRLYSASTLTAYVVTTNGSGVSSFSLDAGAYTRSITKSGYTFTPDTLTVSASASVSSAMTAISIPSPASPSLCVVYGTFLKPSGAALASVDINFTLHSERNTTTGGTVVQTTEWTATTSVAGALSQSLVRTDQFNRPNAYYEVTCAELKWHKKRMTLAAASFDLSTL